MSTEIQTRIQKLEAKLRAAKKEAAAAEKAKKAKELAAKEQADNRKKILVGTFVLEQVKKAGLAEAMLTFETASFEAWLIPAEDRLLFGLKPHA